MLEVSHLTKIYKTKGGISVKALDDVSVNFPETGMVFLLGKSGSGKSTLLNVCGGLDNPTSGEIIVKGRSSKAFSQSDFDSYRNTFVGFIFQEYNILNEFTVEENIALALELQNKPKNKEMIDSLLEKVDLKGFAKRKPNTLSGGQKQRIAIARALIKTPEIIMADEPTGALDSVTGKQVLETLKKLSKDTLVIVVSHDRDFAEIYGDRIIELKDGKIISDVSKVCEEKENLSKNVSILGNTLCIKKGSKLDEKDFIEIKEFLNNSDTDVILAKGENDIKAFKKASRINDSGEKEVFKETDESKIELKKYKKEDSKFIRSKLPLKHAFKIGLSSLKNKPIRLLFTIILCTVSFAMFGLLSTMTFYDNEATFKDTLKNSNYSYLRLNKLYQVNETMYAYGEEDWNYESSNETRFLANEFNEYVNKFGKDVFYGIDVNANFNVQSSTSQYWLNQITTLSYLPNENSLRLKINGNYSVKDDEICISSYTANVILNNKIYDGKTNKILELSKAEDIINKHINIGGYVYKVVGIIDSGSIDPKYDVLLNEESNLLLSEYMSVLSDELHLMAFVSEDRLKQISKEYIPYINDGSEYRSISIALKLNNEFSYPDYGNASYSKYADKLNENIIFFDSNLSELKDNEVILSQSLFYQFMMEYYSNQSNEQTWTYYEIVSELYNNGYYKENEFIKLTEKEANDKLNTLINNIENKQLTIGMRLFDNYSGTSMGEEKEFKIVGIWMDGSTYNNQILLSLYTTDELWNTQKTNLEYYTETETKYKPENTMYGTIYLPFNQTEEEINTFWDIYSNNEFKEDDSKVRISSYMIDNLEMVDSMIESMSKVFLYVGLVLAVFAILLFSNFISVSISNKKKEIGILRAVGARSVDVFKIFFSESFIITLICVLLSTIGSVVVCDLLNKTLSIGIGISIFVFGITSLLSLILIALISSVVATFIPVHNAAKKKPVDSIRAL